MENRLKYIGIISLLGNHFLRTSYPSLQKNCWLCLAFRTRRLQETWRKLARLYQTASEFYFVYKKRDRIWCCLAQSGQLPSIFLPIFGPGNQIEPAIFCLAPSGMISSGCLGFGVARALACHHLTGFFRHPGVLKVPTFLVFTLSFEFFLLVSF